MELGSLLPKRSIEDILAERVRVVLGGELYVLPVKPMRAHREWEERLDLELVRLLMTVRDDGDDVGAILRALAASPDRFIDLLLSYGEDATPPLPDRETVWTTATEWQLFIGCMEVWRAGHPKADIGLAIAAMTALPENGLPGLTSSLSPLGRATPTDGSKAN